MLFCQENLLFSVNTVETVMKNELKVLVGSPLPLVEESGESEEWLKLLGS
jgi:hypothetical protein